MVTVRHSIGPDTPHAVFHVSISWCQLAAHRWLQAHLSKVDIEHPSGVLTSELSPAGCSAIFFLLSVSDGVLDYASIQPMQRQLYHFNAIPELNLLHSVVHIVVDL